MIIHIFERRALIILVPLGIWRTQLLSFILLGLLRPLLYKCIEIKSGVDAYLKADSVHDLAERRGCELFDVVAWLWGFASYLLLHFLLAHYIIGAALC